jgi:hypothetical protein
MAGHKELEEILKEAIIAQTRVSIPLFRWRD